MFCFSAASVGCGTSDVFQAFPAPREPESHFQLGFVSHAVGEPVNFLQLCSALMGH